MGVLFLSTMAIKNGHIDHSLVVLSLKFDTLKHTNLVGVWDHDLE